MPWLREFWRIIKSKRWLSKSWTALSKHYQWFEFRKEYYAIRNYILKKIALIKLGRKQWNTKVNSNKYSESLKFLIVIWSWKQKGIEWLEKDKIILSNILVFKMQQIHFQFNFR